MPSINLFFSSIKSLLFFFSISKWDIKASYFDLYSVNLSDNSSFLVWDTLYNFNNFSYLFLFSSFIASNESYLPSKSFKSLYACFNFSFNSLFSPSISFIFFIFIICISYSLCIFSYFSITFFNSSFSFANSLHLFSINSSFNKSCFNFSFSSNKLWFSDSFFKSLLFNAFIFFSFCWRILKFSSLFFFSKLYLESNSLYFLSISLKQSSCWFTSK